MDLDEIITAEWTMKGGRTCGYLPLSFRGEFDMGIRSLAAGDVDTDVFVSTTIAPDDVVEEGFEAPADADGEHVKALVLRSGPEWFPRSRLAKKRFGRLERRYRRTVS